MNLIDILIGDEPEPGMENLHQVEIPDHLKEKFKKEDEEDKKEYMQEISQSSTWAHMDYFYYYSYGIHY